MSSGRFTDQQLRSMHQALPAPVGGGRGISMELFSHPVMAGMIFAVSGRIERGAIPYPLEDFRCSYCMICHDDKALRCSGCQKVYYCNPVCQKKHWRWHKKVCGTVTQSWDLEEWRHPGHDAEE